MSIDTKGEIRDIKGPMSSPWTFEDLWPYLLGTVVLSAAIAGGYVYYRRWRLRKHDIVPQALPAIPAHKEALAALRALEEKKLWQQGKVKLFHSEATEIIRLFFERRWNVIALELTTEEILLHMRRFPEAVSVWQEMESFFHRADLVKFAKLIPTPEDCAGEMRIAYEIVRAMVPQEPPESREPREETSVTEEAAHVR